MGGLELRAIPQAADFFQCARQSRGIARELHRRCVREKFALAADCGLDEAAKEHASPAEDQKCKPEQGKGIAVSAAAARLEQNAPDNRQAYDAENDSHEAQIKPHVAVENVAEFVANDALQLIAREQFDAAFGHADNGIAGGMTGGERVDAPLLGQ